MYANLIAVWQNGPLDLDVVPANTAQVLDLPAGTDADVGVQLVDEIGRPVSLTFDAPGTDKLELIARLTNGGRLFSKQATKLAAGSYKFAFAAADTRDYSGRLIYEVYATWDGVKRRVISPGHILLGLGVAR